VISLQDTAAYPSKGFPPVVSSPFNAKAMGKNLNYAARNTFSYLLLQQLYS
jgi:hypothetical protein